jgi:hypothetical protein
MEIDAKLKRKEIKRILIEIEEEKEEGKEKHQTEKEEVDELMEGVDEARKVFIANREDEEYKSNFYFILESFYMYLCHLMKKHKMYYREGDDLRLAVLRR